MPARKYNPTIPRRLASKFATDPKSMLKTVWRVAGADYEGASELYLVVRVGKRVTLLGLDSHTLFDVPSYDLIECTTPSRFTYLYDHATHLLLRNDHTIKLKKELHISSPIRLGDYVRVVSRHRYLVSVRLLPRGPTVFIDQDLLRNFTTYFRDLKGNERFEIPAEETESYGDTEEVLQPVAVTEEQVPSAQEVPPIVGITVVTRYLDDDTKEPPSPTVLDRIMDAHDPNFSPI